MAHVLASILARPALRSALYTISGYAKNERMGGAPIGAGGHDPPLLEAKGTGGT